MKKRKIWSYIKVVAYTVLISFTVMLFIESQGRISGRKPSAQQMISGVVHHIKQAVELDEELIILSCVLLFSVSISFFLVNSASKAKRRKRIFYLFTAICYSVLALVLGTLIRHKFHQPVEMYFHLVYSVIILLAFWRIFRKRYLIIKTNAG